VREGWREGLGWNWTGIGLINWCLQVHFHMIPKPNEEEGLSIGWPQQKTDMEGLKALLADIKSKM